jgi:hypothetical protein
MILNGLKTMARFRRSIDEVYLRAIHSTPDLLAKFQAIFTTAAFRRLGPGGGV